MAAGDACGEKALELVEDGMVLGLGTGRAAAAFVRALGRQVAAGLKVRGIPTSDATEELARSLGIELIGLADVEAIDLTVDGADEVDPALDVIKGYGGALVREKIVAAASRRLVILVGAEKLVTGLGARGRLPVEVVPFGVPVVERKLAELGFPAAPRLDGEGRPVISDNGNAILDCVVRAPLDGAAVDRAICAIPGVVDTGLFVGMAERVIVEGGERVEVRTR